LLVRSAAWLSAFILEVASWLRLPLRSYSMAWSETRVPQPVEEVGVVVALHLVLVFAPVGIGVAGDLRVRVGGGGRVEAP
jgi:hypothetical protein